MDVKSLLEAVPLPQRPVVLGELLASSSPFSPSSLAPLVSWLVPQVVGGGGHPGAALACLGLLLKHCPSLPSLHCPTLLPPLQQLLGRRQSEDTLHHTLACVTLLVQNTLPASESGRLIATSAPNLINHVLHLERPHQGLNFLSVLMKRYPGSCGFTKPKLESLFLSLVGSPAVSLPCLCKCFLLLSQVGGGGKEGSGHTASHSALLAQVIETAGGLLTELYQPSQAPAPPVTRHLLSLSPLKGSTVARQVGRVRQVQHLLSIAAHLVAGGFPVPRSVSVDKLLNLVRSSVSAFLSKEKVSQGAGVSQLLPCLLVSSLSLVSVMICGLSPDLLLPVAPTINSLLLSLLTATNTPKVRLATLHLLSTWVARAGASSGLELVAEKIIPQLLMDLRPTSSEDSVTLVSEGPGGGRKKKNRKKGGGGGPKVSTLSPQESSTPELTISALRASEGLLLSLGPWIPKQTHAALSVGLLSLASHHNLDKGVDKALVSCMTALRSSSGQLNAGQLVLSLLPLKRLDQELDKETKNCLLAWESSIHTQRPSLDWEDSHLLTFTKANEESNQDEDMEEDNVTIDSSSQTDGSLKNELKERDSKIDILKAEISKLKRSLEQRPSNNHIKDMFESVSEPLTEVDVPHIGSTFLSSNKSLKRVVESEEGEIISKRSKVRSSESDCSSSLTKSDLISKSNEQNRSEVAKSDDKTYTLSADKTDGGCVDEELSVDDMLQDFNSRLASNLSRVTTCTMYNSQDSDSE